jgi:hypothetical protein
MAFMQEAKKMAAAPRKYGELSVACIRGITT